MKKILLESEEIGPTVIEFSNILKSLERMYSCQYRILKASKVKNRDICWCDVIISVRSLSSIDYGIARFAKKRGKYHVLLLDDDFLGIASDYGVSGSGMWVKRKEALRKMLDVTDMICSSNHSLGEKYTHIGKVSSYCITNTIVSPESIVSPNKNWDSNRKIKIMYYVNDGTTKMFNEYIMPIMQQLCERYKKKISLTLMALKPDLSAYEKDMDIRYIEHMYFKEFREFVADQHFDIGIAPLDGIGFSRYKYFNKFIEHSIGGMAGIYSKCEPYTFIIKDKVNGILCENTPEAWLEAFELLINNAEVRQNCIINAQNQIRKDFTAEKIVKDLVNDIPELIKYSAPKSKFYYDMFWIKLNYILFCMGEYWYFAVWHLEKDGLIKLIMRVFGYTRKIIRNKLMEDRIIKEWKYE